MKSIILSKHKSILRLFMIFFTIFSILQPYTICRCETSSTNTSPIQTDLKDGEYSIDITLEGGSGRASLSSPSKLIIKDSFAYAHIEWNSSNYDYMKIDNTVYKPINTDGNSVFEIPIAAFNKQIPIKANTTAMSTPHEISYTLTFHMDSIKKDNILNLAAIIPIVLVVIICCFAVFRRIIKRTPR